VLRVLGIRGELIIFKYRRYTQGKNTLMASKKQDAQDEGGLIFQNLRKLINIVDELRDVGLQQYINLPRIAVLGT
jgi:hypothetical protein